MTIIIRVLHHVASPVTHSLLSSDQIEELMKCARFLWWRVSERERVSYKDGERQVIGCYC